MRFRLFLVAIACVVTVAVAAQEPATTFDVVSVKPNLSGETRSGTESLPDRINATNVTLRSLILRAYNKQEFEVIGGPDWVSTDRFDVVARGSATGDRGARLQAMLADRFKLATHTEMRDRPVYFLVPARPDKRLGPSMTPATIDCSGDGDPGARRREAGMNICGLRTSTGRNGGTVTGGGLTLERIADTLANYAAERPIIDRTGIEGIFDFELKWVNQPTNNADDVSFFTAVQEQLGLKLEAGTAPVEVLVIDRAERPDPN
jgi:uncharacterized protein (TIGR03435 family)